MIFEARCQSFKILLMMLVMVVSLIGNCQAERTPISLDRGSFQQDLIGVVDIQQFDRIKQDRQRDEKLWSDFKQFAGGQVLAAKQKLASLDLSNWWGQQGGRDVSPAVQRQPAQGNTADAISTTAIALKFAANMTALQWWQASHLAEDLLSRGQQRVAQATSKLDADMQSSLFKLVELASSHVVQLADSPQVDGVIQVFTVAKSSDSSNADSLVTKTSTDEDPTADPYWQYYADCDFWGAQFDVAKD